MEAVKKNGDALRYVKEQNRRQSAWKLSKKMAML